MINDMKIVLAAALILLVSGVSFAQELSAEKDFEKNKPRLTLEKFAVGEDATSGFDYLVYTDKSSVVKLRSIWSSSTGIQSRVEDYYFKDGVLLLYVRMLAENRNLKPLVRGQNVPLTVEEKLYLKDSKLTTWIEKRKTVPATDARRNDREKEVLEMAKAELENYQSMKTENNDKQRFK
jgi:hypothetical protein